MVHDITVCFAGIYSRLFFYLVEVKKRVGGTFKSLVGPMSQQTRRFQPEKKVWCQLLSRQTIRAFAQSSVIYTLHIMMCFFFLQSLDIKHAGGGMGQAENKKHSGLSNVRSREEVRGLKTGRGAFLQTDPAERGQHQQEPGRSSQPAAHAGITHLGLIT